MNKVSYKIEDLLASDSIEKRKKGFEVLINNYYSFMFARARAIIKNDVDAEDIVYHFLEKKIINEKYTINKEKIKNIKAFLNTAITHEAKNKCKKLNKKRENEESLKYKLLENEYHDIEIIMQKLIELDLFKKCIIKKNNAELLEFFKLFCNGYKIQEIVKQMNLDYNQTRNIKSRFIRQGQKCAKQLDIESIPWI